MQYRWHLSTRASAAIESIEPKQNTRPLAASLEAVAGDLGKAKGSSVVLIVHGDETCSGNVASAIARLLRSDDSMRVNIVGFAIDDAKLTGKFRLLAQVGQGKYFEARDASELAAALIMALRPSFEVLDANRRVVATGVAEDDPVQIVPGTYTVRLRSGSGDLRAVLVRSNETTHAPF